MGDLAQILGLALLSAFNPTLLAAVTVILLMPSPKRLMLGYLLGAYTTSITVGLLIVFAFHDSGVVNTTKSTISPAQDLVLGLILLLVAVVLRTGRSPRRRGQGESTGGSERSEGEGEDKRDPLSLRLLGRGSPRIAFAIGLVLSFPGASYLVALGHIDRLGASAALSAMLVIGVCVVQQLLLELPLLGYVFAPERTSAAVRAFRGWLTRNGRRAGGNVAGVLGLALVVRGLIVLL